MCIPQSFNKLLEAAQSPSEDFLSSDFVFGELAASLFAYLTVFCHFAPETKDFREADELETFLSPKVNFTFMLLNRNAICAFLINFTVTFYP